MWAGTYRHMQTHTDTCSHVQTQTDTCRHMQAQTIHRFVCFIEKVLFSHSSIHSANFQRGYNLCYLYFYYLTIGRDMNKHIILFRVDTQRYMQAQTESRILITFRNTQTCVQTWGNYIICSIIIGNYIKMYTRV